jgi:hypothetical protein
VRRLAAMMLLVAFVLSAGAGGFAQRPEDPTRKPKDDGYRGIWFTLGQYTDVPYGGGNKKRYWEYGDKYSGGLGTYTAKHVPIAIYAPSVKKTFFCYGGSKEGKRYLYNMVSYYDHEKDLVPRPTIVHDKGGVDDPHDNSSLALDADGHLWVYVAGRARSRPGFVYRSSKPYDIDHFELISSDEICYPQPHAIVGEGIFELFTKYTGVRELYWNFRKPDGSRGEDRKLAGMEGQYQTSFCRGRRVITAFNRHVKGSPDRRTDLYYAETGDLGRTWQTVDGQTLETPLVDPKNPALVKAYSEEDRYVYLNSVTLDKGGNPLILVVTSSDHRPGPQGDPRVWEVLHYQQARWNRHEVTRSTHNYDTGPIWVEPNGMWRIIGPTETGPQRWGGGGEIAVWTSSDEGDSWVKRRKVTSGSARNQSYVRKVFGAEDDSPFALLWADGHADKLSVSRIYFADRDGGVVRRLPYDMPDEVATPEVVQGVAFK